MVEKYLNDINVTKELCLEAIQCHPAIFLSYSLLPNISAKSVITVLVLEE